MIGYSFNNKKIPNAITFYQVPSCPTRALSCDTLSMSFNTL